MNVQTLNHAMRTDIDVPFTSNWVEIEPRSISGSSERHGGALSKLHFKPRGSIIRIQPGTTLHGNGAISAITMSSQAFSPEGKFSFAGRMPGQSIDFTHSTPTEWRRKFVLSSHWGIPNSHIASSTQPIFSVGSGYEWYIPLWVMPRAHQPLGAAGLSLSIDIVTGRPAEPTVEMPTTYQGLRAALVEKKSYTLKAVVKRPRLPIEYAYGLHAMSHHGLRLRPGSTGIYETDGPEITQPLPAGYHQPSFLELTSLFGGVDSRDFMWGFHSQYSPASLNWYENLSRYYIYRSVQLTTPTTMPESSYSVNQIIPSREVKCIIGGQIVQNYKDNWVRWTSKLDAVYALRFLGAEGNKYLSAWRYHFYSEGAAFYMGIRARYLGPLWTDMHLPNIASEAWWSGYWGNDREFSIRIQMFDYKTTAIPSGVDLIASVTLRCNDLKGWGIFYRAYDGLCHIPGLPNHYRKSPIAGSKASYNTQFRYGHAEYTTDWVNLRSYKLTIPFRNGTL